MTAIDLLDQACREWREKATASREEAGRIRRTVYVATEAEANCNIRAEVWDKCADEVETIIAKLRAEPASTRDAQINHMVDRFLAWKLPDNFNPDGGISFKRTRNEHTSFPSKNEPVGTNLFDADQAKEMVRYMLDNLPAEPAPDREAMKVDDLIEKAHDEWKAESIRINRVTRDGAGDPYYEGADDFRASGQLRKYFEAALTHAKEADPLAPTIAKLREYRDQNNRADVENMTQEARDGKA